MERYSYCFRQYPWSHGILPHDYGGGGTAGKSVERRHQKHVIHVLVKRKEVLVKRGVVDIAARNRTVGTIRTSRSRTDIAVRCRRQQV